MLALEDVAGSFTLNFMLLNDAGVLVIPIRTLLWFLHLYVGLQIVFQAPCTPMLPSDFLARSCVVAGIAILSLTLPKGPPCAITVQDPMFRARFAQDMLLPACISLYTHRYQYSHAALCILILIHTNIGTKTEFTWHSNTRIKCSHVEIGRHSNFYFKEAVPTLWVTDPNWTQAIILYSILVYTCFYNLLVSQPGGRLERRQKGGFML